MVFGLRGRGGGAGVGAGGGGGGRGWGGSSSKAEAAECGPRSCMACPPLSHTHPWRTCPMRSVLPPIRGGRRGPGGRGGVGAGRCPRRRSPAALVQILRGWEAAAATGPWRFSSSSGSSPWAPSSSTSSKGKAAGVGVGDGGAGGQEVGGGGGGGAFPAQGHSPLTRRGSQEAQGGKGSDATAQSAVAEAMAESGVDARPFLFPLGPQFGHRCPLGFSGAPENCRVAEVAWGAEGRPGRLGAGKGQTFCL